MPHHNSHVPGTRPWAPHSSGSRQSSSCSVARTEHVRTSDPYIRIGRGIGSSPSTSASGSLAVWSSASTAMSCILLDGSLPNSSTSQPPPLKGVSGGFASTSALHAAIRCVLHQLLRYASIGCERGRVISQQASHSTLSNPYRARHQGHDLGLSPSRHGPVTPLVD